MKNSKNAKAYCLFVLFAVGTLSSLILSVIALIFSTTERNSGTMSETVSCSCTYEPQKEETSETPSNENEDTNSNLMELPEINTNVKLFTDYRAYNLWWTPHYRLQQSARTDERGLRRFGDDYIVALGSYYSTNIGDRFRVTLDNGNCFTVIFGDGKCDVDCDSQCMYTPCTDYSGEAAANVLEFIIDRDILDASVYAYGSIEILDGFEGNIVEMEYLGRDTSQDWDTYETM